ncbi:jg27812 [Pararge aegeria aegeria]|uniref:Jg27812 protein n=1 Tax=Pararge aegeria aegeria TaxID=348720 RepID=A0A8S4S1T9_9NEOP|nr:jg27812 [Pararge aegeria aegeria]
MQFISDYEKLVDILPELLCLKRRSKKTLLLDVPPSPRYRRAEGLDMATHGELWRSPQFLGDAVATLKVIYYEN